MKVNSESILNKKKKVIILLLFFIVIILMLAGFLIGAWVYDSAKKNETQTGNVDTSNVNEKVNR